MKNSEQPINATLTYNSVTGEANGHFLGLTKREYFAGLAMQGLISNPYLSSPREPKLKNFPNKLFDMQINY